MAYDKYKNKDELIKEIQKRARLFIGEYADIQPKEWHTMFDEIGKTPYQILAYQVGWMELVLKWESEEKELGHAVMPLDGYGWNQHAEIHGYFYDKFSTCSNNELIQIFKDKCDELITWLEALNKDEVIKQGYRKWTGDKENWPIAKWVHINTVAPFSSFRSKIRKFKKLNRQ